MCIIPFMDKKSKAAIYIILLAIFVSLITCIKSVPERYCEPDALNQTCPQTHDFIFPGIESFLMKTFGYYFLLCLATYVGKDMFPENNKYPSSNILGSPKFQ
jgi:hypothetical protein